MDMGSLQAALPHPRIPDAFLEAISGCSTSFTQGHFLFLCISLIDD
jgi:hypothetical protein